MKGAEAYDPNCVAGVPKNAAAKMLEFEDLLGVKEDRAETDRFDELSHTRSYGARPP